MVAVFDVIRVAARQSASLVNDQVNVMHFSVHTVPTPNTDAQVMTDIGTIVSTCFAEIESFIPTIIDPIDLTFYNVTTDAPMGQITWPGPYNGGTASGEVLPLHDSALLLMQTSVKRTVGRIYLPTFTEASQNTSQWVAGVVTAVDSFASMLLVDTVPTASNGEYRYGVYKRGTGAMAFPNSARLAKSVAVQTRRKPGRGS